MQARTMYIISKADPIKYILSRPVLHGWLVKWEVILEQYELANVSQKTTKGQVPANFLADHPVSNDWELNDDLLREEVFFEDVLLPREMFLMMLRDGMVPE